MNSENYHEELNHSYELLFSASVNWCDWNRIEGKFNHTHSERENVRMMYWRGGNAEHFVEIVLRPWTRSLVSSDMPSIFIHFPTNSLVGQAINTPSDFFLNSHFLLPSHLFSCSLSIIANDLLSCWVVDKAPRLFNTNCYGNSFVANIARCTHLFT